ncbi:MAG: hypothetical protein ABS87_04005 [Sphingomonas sp. SCN 67-18]|nr:MAG: hypothetical protein ABS87_04005 [Sphingomonas sp. SCN 67-18]
MKEGDVSDDCHVSVRPLRDWKIRPSILDVLDFLLDVTMLLKNLEDVGTRYRLHNQAMTILSD